MRNALPMLVAVGRKWCSSSLAISSSIFISMSSGSLNPSRLKNLMPLSWYGLWLAEMTAPASARIETVSCEMAGVGSGPQMSTSTPMLQMPEASAVSSM